MLNFPTMCKALYNSLKPQWIIYDMQSFPSTFITNRNCYYKFTVINANGCYLVIISIDSMCKIFLFYFTHVDVHEYTRMNLPFERQIFALYVNYARERWFLFRNKDHELSCEQNDCICSLCGRQRDLITFIVCPTISSVPSTTRRPSSRHVLHTAHDAQTAEGSR